MDRNFLTRNAFSLIELAIAMGLMAVMTAAVVPVAVRGLEIKAGEKTIVEVGIIQGAASKYYAQHHAWPADLKELQTAGYLSPIWTLKNPWDYPYQAIFAAKTMTVKTEVPANIRGMLIARLPQASIDGNAIISVAGSSDNNIISSGVIVAWSGAIASIPIGWLLCDGQNGTPDLRDKFIVGASQDEENVAKTRVTGLLSKDGGSISHAHGGATGAHALTIAEMPAHHHGYNETPWLGSRYDGHSSPVMTGQVGSNTSDTGGNQAHTHPISQDKHLPPFYALAFIMKV